MTNTDVQPLNRLLAPVAVAAAAALLAPASSGVEMAALWTLAVVVTVAHLHYGVCVVSLEMCDRQTADSVRGGASVCAWCVVSGVRLRRRQFDGAWLWVW